MRKQVSGTTVEHGLVKKGLAEINAKTGKLVLSEKSREIFLGKNLLDKYGELNGAPKGYGRFFAFLTARFKTLKGVNVLDLGFGERNDVPKHLQECGANVTAMDIDSKHVENGKKNAPKVKFVEGSVANILDKITNMGGVDDAIEDEYRRVIAGEKLAPRLDLNKHLELFDVVMVKDLFEVGSGIENSTERFNFSRLRAQSHSVIYGIKKLLKPGGYFLTQIRLPENKLFYPHELEVMGFKLIGSEFTTGPIPHYFIVAQKPR